MDWIYWVDLFGTVVFAISGTLTARHQKFDLVGTLIIGFVTAIGGGTIRDVLIGRFPVGWLNDRAYFVAILIGYIIAYTLSKQVRKFRRSMFLFDTVGIGLFTILGFQLAYKQELNLEICLLLGVISACFGGVLRDVLSNVVPLIFRKEIYATACFFGGLFYWLLAFVFRLPDPYAIIPSIIFVILIRYFSIRYQWTLNWEERKEKRNES